MPRAPRVRPVSAEFSVPVLPVRDAVLFPGQIHTLHVAREGSKRSARQAIADGKLLFVISQRDQTVEDPAPADLNRIGTLCEPVQSVPLPDGSVRIALRCLRRAEAKRYHRVGGMISALCSELPEAAEANVDAEALMRLSIDAFAEVVEKGRKIPAEAIETVANQDSSSAVADAIAHHLPLRPAQKQPLLEELSGEARLQQVFELLRREQRLLQVQSEISERVDRDFAATQREYFLREQLRAIQTELQAYGPGSSELASLRESLDAAALPEGAHSKALQELSRLEHAAPYSPEATVVRTYIDWMVSLPWAKLSPDNLDIGGARQILDDAHFGLREVKERILDFLAVRQLSQSLRGPILCFVGPPGVGKTSVGRSIAEALGRQFVRISLGGLRDEAEIRGHRRTYVGAQPGRIIQSLRQCGTRNPVMVLDEIDKMASDFRGDPSGALLEALDPSQNERFSDHYLEIPFDLSSVLFIATANLVEDIPHALRDRMEIVRFTSYTEEERVKIAEQFILPRLLEPHGLAPKQLRITRSAIESLVRDYTREAGVRELERTIAAVCRKSARRIAEGKVRSQKVTSASLERFLGSPPHLSAARASRGEVGSVNALVVTENGGDVIPIEVLLLEAPESGPSLRMTGNLGAVMRESAEAALSFVRSTPDVCDHRASEPRDLHIHVPDNAVPKEGPSAGLAIAVALASAFTGRSVKPGIAMTGEITLRGKLLPVGGIREKLGAAAREGLETVLLPEANRRDVEDVPNSVLKRISLRFVESAAQAIELALGPGAPLSAVVQSEPAGAALNRK